MSIWQNSAFEKSSQLARTDKGLKFEPEHTIPSELGSIMRSTRDVNTPPRDRLRSYE